MSGETAVGEAAAGETRAGFIAVIGATNAGKSTLTNRLVGAKVSIVSQKVQTTRSRITGIVMHGAAQVLLVDTPGIFKPRRRLDRAMIAAAWAGAADADLVLWMVDAERGLDAAAEGILDGLRGQDRPVYLALNKIDRVPRETLLGLAEAFNAAYGFVETFMISAANGDGCAHLLDRLAQALPAGPWLFPEDQLSDLPERMLAAEITREKVFERLHQELPYSSTVETEAFRQQGDGSLRIDQVIFVERDSQKPIVLGKGGQTIKAIGSLARRDMEPLFGKTVHLFLFVKVRDGWADDPERYRAMGLDWQP